MSVFQGVPIQEYRLLVYYALSPIMIIASLVAIGVCIYNLFGGRDKKVARNLKSLKLRAETDVVAMARLEKLKRKMERRKKRYRSERILDGFVLAFLIAFVLLTAFVGVVNPITDYVHKDYVVYTGEIKVYPYVRYSRIILDDGTAVWGIGGLTVEDTYATIVYTSRGKVFLGAKTE